MAHTLLSPTAITRKALMVLHQECNFVGSINRQYDDRFAKAGAKIGQSLQIRKPNQFTVRTGKTINVQDITEEQVTLSVATQAGVDWEFSSADLTMTIDDFNERYITPAMKRLAAHIEADAMSMYKQVPNEIVDVGATITLDHILDGEKKLTDNLCPTDSRRLNLNTLDNRDLVDALTGFYHPQQNITSQFRKSMVANNFLGFENVYRNTLWPVHTTGTEAGADTGYNVTAVSADGLTLTVDTGTATFLEGDIIQIEDCLDVHPETKDARAAYKQFTVTADSGTNATSISIYPPLLSSGARQTVNSAPVTNAAVYKRESDDSTAVGNAADYNISLGYHKDAFTFVTADLQMPKAMDMAAREVSDGISMRFVRGFDITNDMFPARFDVLYGYKAIRPEWAVRFGFN